MNETNRNNDDDDVDSFLRVFTAKITSSTSPVATYLGVYFFGGGTCMHWFTLYCQLISFMFYFFSLPPSFFFFFFLGGGQQVCSVTYPLVQLRFPFLL